MKALSTFTVLALGAAVLAVSCQKRFNEQEPVPAGSRTFQCVIASPDTRVAVSDAGKTTWEAGDEILVHGAGSSNRKVVSLAAGDISADGKTATITVEGIEPYDRSDKGYTSTYYACYPASAVASGNLYYYGRFTETNHLLMAAYNVEDTFVFYNLCGVISFKVSGDFDSYEFSGNGKETVGYTYYQCRLAATDGDPVLQFNYGNASDGGTSGPLTSVSGALTADGETVNYVGIPMGADFTKGFSFKFKDGDTFVKMAVSSAPVTLERNQILVLGDITDHLEEYVPADHESDIPTEGAVDLSADGSANCYVITAPGIYKFPAVMGNSDASAGDVYGVELLWETCNDAETVSANSVLEAVDYEDNWLYIETPDPLLPGNALVAAKDFKGKIIWSWHIWIPETTITTGTYSLATAQLMDRNLGALVAATAGSDPVDVHSVGLAYEWGRKDPFPGPKALGSSSGQATVAGKATTMGREKVSVEESVAIPTTFVTVDNDSWSVEEDADLWTKEGAKNIYDPCPPGYKVPTRQEAPAFFVSDLSAVDGWATSTSGYWFTVGSSDAVFPMGGYIDDCNESYSFSYTGSRVAVWSADASGAKKAYAVDVRFGNRQQVAGPARSRGGYVRCIAEEGNTEPFENAEGMPEMGSYTKILVGEANELSGLCLSADKSFMWGVGDNGELYQIGFDGTVTTVWTHSADMEGVTLHPSTGDLYIAVEGEQKVYRVPVPNYSNYQSVIYVQEAIDGSYGNIGLEGITYYKDDLLYIGSQYGATLWTYDLSGNKVSKKLLTTIAPGIEEVGDLFYDPETDWLWVSDSEAHKIFVFKGDVSELLAIYDISFISNAEAICVDHAHSCVWVGSDDSTSKLFKIDFT